MDPSDNIGELMSLEVSRGDDYLLISDEKREEGIARLVASGVLFTVSLVIGNEIAAAACVKSAVLALFYLFNHQTPLEYFSDFFLAYASYRVIFGAIGANTTSYALI